MRDLHLAAAHLRHRGLKLAALAIEQGQGLARLQPQHLHMARRLRGQGQQGIGLQRCLAIKTGHGLRLGLAHH